VEFYYAIFMVKINVGHIWGHLFNTCHNVALKLHGYSEYVVYEKTIIKRVA